MYRLRKYIYEY